MGSDQKTCTANHGPMAPGQRARCEVCAVKKSMKNNDKTQDRKGGRKCDHDDTTARCAMHRIHKLCCCDESQTQTTHAGVSSRRATQ